MQFSTLFFDVDDTLYNHDTGVWEAIRNRMVFYMTERLGFSDEDVDQFRGKYLEKYGTTLRGLMINYPDRVDPEDFLAYVHDLPVREMLAPDPGLRGLLQSMKGGQRWVFTNADASHAKRVLDALGVSDCFDGLIDLLALDHTCKPLPEAYQRALAISGEQDPHRCLMIDDSPRNLAPAHEMGFFTVRVGSTETHPAADLSIARLSDLPSAMPELWQG